MTAEAANPLFETGVLFLAHDAALFRLPDQYGVRIGPPGSSPDFEEIVNASMPFLRLPSSVLNDRRRSSRMAPPDLQRVADENRIWFTHHMLDLSEQTAMLFDPNRSKDGLLFVKDIT